MSEHPENPTFYQCVTFGFFATPRQEMAYNLFCVVAMYFLPLLVISFAYSRILCVIVSRSSDTRGQYVFLFTRQPPDYGDWLRHTL